jgi:hypothetical protein
MRSWVANAAAKSRSAGVWCAVCRRPSSSAVAERGPAGLVTGSAAVDLTGRGVLCGRGALGSQ